MRPITWAQIDRLLNREGKKGKEDEFSGSADNRNIFEVIDEFDDENKDL